MQVMLTLRDPAEWAHSRLSHHILSHMTVCRDNLHNSASFYNIMDCMRDSHYLGENIFTIGSVSDQPHEELEHLDGIRIAMHNYNTIKRVKPENVHEMCVFDFDMDDASQYKVRST